MNCSQASDVAHGPLVLQIVAVGIISESAALRYDAVFSHRQIDLVFSSMSVGNQSMSTNLLIWKWTMFTCGILLVIGAIFTLFTIQKHSKLLHLLVGLLKNEKNLLSITSSKEGSTKIVNFKPPGQGFCARVWPYKSLSEIALFL